MAQSHTKQSSAQSLQSPVYITQDAWLTTDRPEGLSRVIEPARDVRAVPLRAAIRVTRRLKATQCNRKLETECS